MSGRSFYAARGKRWFDVIVAGTSLVVLSPVLLCVALLVRWRLGAPVLFRQERIGLDGRPFVITKFRTMRPASGAESDAARLSSFGKWLRSTSIDELPELGNVLRGEMSIIGPRPLLPEYLPRYSAEQARRHEVRPGITGLAQVSGRNRLSWEAKFERDVEYVDSVSFWVDLRILTATIVWVMRREGVAADSHATMPRFGENQEGPPCKP